MSRSNESRSMKSHETCKCICRLNKIICNNKQRRNKDHCRCECKELIDKGVCDKIYTFNLSNCKCECDKSCNTSQYVDYLNCECKKKKLIELLKNVLSMMIIKQKKSIKLYKMVARFVLY